MASVRRTANPKGSTIRSTRATMLLYWDCVRLLAAIEQEQKRRGLARDQLRRASGRGPGPRSRGVGERVLRRALGNLYKCLHHKICPSLGLDVAALRAEWDLADAETAGDQQQPTPKEMPDIRRLRPKVDG